MINVTVPAPRLLVPADCVGLTIRCAQPVTVTGRGRGLKVRVR